MAGRQVISKQRVAEHGEVYTHAREVKAMLDLVVQETERIDARFLEPACGTGNFLVEIVARKLAMVKARYKKSQLEYERYAVIAIGSLYGIDILADNVTACRQRLLDIFSQHYSKLYKTDCRQSLLDAVRYILSRNIAHGDALTLKTVGDAQHCRPIVFSEWSAVNGSMIKRRDFIYAHLVDTSSHREMPLFSDLDELAYIPEPVHEYPLTHYLEVGNAG